jgi:DNA polymerase elongation subunit (family B)
MNLLNIHNQERDIYLFCRKNDGTQTIIQDGEFFPYWFEPDNLGECIGYDGTKLKKVYTSLPSEVSKMRTVDSYSSDIPFTKMYVLDKIEKIDISPIKYFFIDIEIQSKEFPKPEEAKYPVSCISLYNSFDKNITTWWLPDYKNEEEMLDDFVEYIHNEAPDIIFAWNINFDYNYLYNRIPNFAKKISPVGLDRYCREDVKYPVGISIIDYSGNKKQVGLFSKIKNKESSYALDDIAKKHLGVGKTYKNKDIDFSTLHPNIKKRNIQDVQFLVDLEKKFQIIPYYDEVRRISKVSWEELIYNSRIVEMLLLQEAKLKNIVLPNKKDNINTVDIIGATREALRVGVFSDVAKCDLTSAYPSVIIDFCLDSQNIVEEEGDNVINIDGILFKQNKNALLPSVVKKILELKDNLKQEKNKNPKDDVISLKYDAIKGIVNSTFGTMASPYFRLYDQKVGSSITFLVRNLLLYCKEGLEKNNYEVLYWDTDGIMVNSKENISGLLNILIRDWSKTFNKEKINLSFEYEGYFEKLFLLGKCHYVGYVNKNGKIEKEIKGVEIKRSSSSKIEAEFQEELIDKILNKEPQVEIEKWIKRIKLKMRNRSVVDIAFPCKLNSTEYKGLPIFVRALENTKRIKKEFDVQLGERYYYVYVMARGDIDVLAFKEDDLLFLEDFKINWGKMYDRNIDSKVNKINECLGWNISTTNQKRLF